MGLIIFQPFILFCLSSVAGHIIKAWEWVGKAEHYREVAPFVGRTGFSLATPLPRHPFPLPKISRAGHVCHVRHA